MDWIALSYSGAALFAIALIFWFFSLLRNDVSIVDVLWALMFLVSALVYWATIDSPGPRAGLILGMVGIWAVRLSSYIGWRNHGEPEDYRYQKIRANNDPGFRFKSIYIVFGLQAALAWVISMPLLAAISGQNTPGWIDLLGVLAWFTGMAFEAVGDLQLSRFRGRPENAGKVLDQGLWRYTRHPNYFGNFLIWWGFYLVAFSAGGWWTILSPLLMTVLLLKVSGVALLEKDISNRRPAYQQYIRSTNAFFPGPTRN